jgi:predicted nucleic acid-binding protein
MTPLTLIDTGPIVAAIDRRDHHHQWAYAQFERLPLPFLTCEAVIADSSVNAVYPSCPLW